MSETKSKECALCHKTSKETKKALKRCLQCQSVWYCTVAHQRAHWKNHREDCRAKAKDLMKQANSSTETALQGGRLYVCGTGDLGIPAPSGTHPKTPVPTLDVEMTDPTPIGASEHKDKTATSMEIDVDTPDSASPALSSPTADGDDVMFTHLTLVPRTARRRVHRVDVGSTHVLAAMSNGELFSHGTGEDGQLGLGKDKTVVAQPEEVSALSVHNVVAVAAGYGHSIAVTKKGRVFTWGNGELGQLGLNMPEQATAALPYGAQRWDTSSHFRPKIVKELAHARTPSVHAPHIIAAACGDAHTLFLSDVGQVYVCGDTQFAATGLHSAEDYHRQSQTSKGSGYPIVVPSLLKPLQCVSITSVACGAHHSLAACASGSVFSWGLGKHGATGHGNTKVTPVPARIMDLKEHHVVKVAAGGSTSAAITLEGRLFTWGANQHGQLGLGTTENHYAPALVPPAPFVAGLEPSMGAHYDDSHNLHSHVVVSDVAVGQRHLACVVNERQLYTCGAGESGQLGTGSLVDALVPCQVALPGPPPEDSASQPAPSASASSSSTQAPSRCVIIDIACSLSVTAVVICHEPYTQKKASSISSPDSKPASASSTSLPTDNDEPMQDTADASPAHKSGGMSLRAKRQKLSLRPLVIQDVDVLASLTRAVPRAAFLYSKFKTYLRSSTVNRNFNTVANYLGKVFCSISGLNGSFYPPRNTAPLCDLGWVVPVVPHAVDDEKAPEPLDETETGSKLSREVYMFRYGVDSSAVARSYRLLLSANVVLVNKAHMSAVQVLLKQLQEALDTRLTVQCSGADPAVVRVFAILLQAPLWARAGITEVTLLSDMGRLLLHLPQQWKEHLVRLLSLYPADIFERSLLRNCRMCLSAALGEYKKRGQQCTPANMREDVLHIATIFDVLHTANLLRPPPPTSSARGWVLPGTTTSAASALASPRLLSPTSPATRFMSPHSPVTSPAVVVTSDNPDAPDALPHGGHHFEFSDWRVPSEAFYVEPLEEVVDLGQDFLVWVRTRDNTDNKQKDSDKQDTDKKPSAQLAPFTFSARSYMMSPMCKSQLLRSVSLSTQRAASVQLHMAGGIVPTLVVSKCHLKIRRDHLAEDGLRAISSLHPTELMKPLQIEFVGEDGVDQGGLTAEFMHLIVQHLFNLKYRLFEYDEENRTNWFPVEKNIKENVSKLELYRVAGIIFGLAVFHGINVGVHFPEVLYKKLLGRKPTLEDVRSTDPILWRSLKQLLACSEDVEDVFCLDFTLSVSLHGDANAAVQATSSDDSKKSDAKESDMTVELLPGGADIPVTNDNRDEYVARYVKYRLVDSVAEAFNSFASGFKSIVTPQLLQLLEPSDLELILCGRTKLDFSALKANTRYEGYTPNSQVIKWFWEVVLEDMTEAQRKKLLIFVTGTDRSPLKGLGALFFCIQRAGPDSEFVPTAHVCFNILMLPEYSSKDKLKDKLFHAIVHCEGFGLQ